MTIFFVVLIISAVFSFLLFSLVFNLAKTQKTVKLKNSNWMIVMIMVKFGPGVSEKKVFVNFNDATRNTYIE